MFGGVGAGWRGLFALPVILGGGAALGPLLAFCHPRRALEAQARALLQPSLAARDRRALRGAPPRRGFDPRIRARRRPRERRRARALGLRSPVRTSAPGRQESAAACSTLGAALALVLDGWGAAGSAARLADGGGVIAATAVVDGWLAGRGLESSLVRRGPARPAPRGVLVVAVSPAASARSTLVRGALDRRLGGDARGLRRLPRLRGAGPGVEPRPRQCSRPAGRRRGAPRASRGARSAPRGAAGRRVDRSCRGEPGLWGRGSS